MPSRPNKPLYWVDGDRVMIDDVTRYGLHRKHIVRSGAMPNVESWGASFPQATQAAYMDEHGNGHLWLFWKEQPNGENA